MWIWHTVIYHTRLHMLNYNSMYHKIMKCSTSLVLRNMIQFIDFYTLYLVVDWPLSLLNTYNLKQKVFIYFKIIIINHIVKFNWFHQNIKQEIWLLYNILPENSVLKTVMLAWAMKF